jgi:MOSC domain-containing protein YiiM
VQIVLLPQPSNAHKRGEEVMYRYTLRFNLGAGQHYKKWKLTDTRTGVVEYYDPETTQFQLTDCRLVNQGATARKIHAGSAKAVCAWVACRDYKTVTGNKPARPVMYNPRVTPFWRNAFGENLDGSLIKCLQTVGRELFMGV